MSTQEDFPFVRCSFKSPSPRVQCELQAGHEGEHQASNEDVLEACASKVDVIPTHFGELRVSILPNQCVLISEVYKPTVGPVEREGAGSSLVILPDELRLLLRALLIAAPQVGVICLDPKYMHEVTLSHHDGKTHLEGKKNA